LDRRDACPTFFEFVTVMALKYFAEQNCDLVIWETGMGGRLDATNIVTPLASVITNIQFDHQKWLGNTLEEIAAEKAVIIKPGVPVITATDAPEALEVIAKIAREKDVPLIKVGQASSLSVAGRTPALPLPGEHQRLNAALAVATVRVLQDKVPVSDEAIRRGLETVQWPGRLQLVATASGRTFLLDGAHNAAGAVALREAVCSAAIQSAIPVPPSSDRAARDLSRQDADSTLILGVLEDKDWQEVCAALAPLASRILLVPVPSERSAAPELLRDACAKINPAAQTIACPSLVDALKQSANDPFVIITGSLYLVGEAMERLELSPAPSAGERGLNEWTLRK
jgi:dihydrofolate synthase/folylpolyglutamate synthase